MLKSKKKQGRRPEHSKAKPFRSAEGWDPEILTKKKG